MSLLGYVSDEHYLALPDVSVELTQGDVVAQVRSSASGAVYSDVPPGRYKVTLAKEGFGPKAVDADLTAERPYQFRMLSDRISGYVWPKWARSGDRAELHVHGPGSVRISLRRYGRDVEEEQVISWLDEHGPRAMAQQTPDGDYTQTGVAWSQVGYSTAQKVFMTAPDRSGLYFFHAEGESGGFFSFPWVVAPTVPESPIAVLASTNTWNAYNNFGGRSNYINAAGLPPTPIISSRRELARYTGPRFAENRPPDDKYPPVSFERPEPLNQIGQQEQPLDPIRGRQTCHLAAAEWRLLSWLEREGYRHDLYAEAHLHDGTLNLDQYRVLVLNTHPEYWSREMFQTVRDWVNERGGRLLYLGGNGLDCEVEFLDPTRLHYRTQYPDPNTHFDSRMHRTFESPASLLGVVYTPAGATTGAPFKVTSADHWVFHGTGLRDGDLFGQRSLHERCPGGASGHETDKTNANTPEGTQVVARGCNPDEGGAQLAVRELNGGGLVFSAGSITWSASINVDAAVSQITRNVLNRALG